MDYHKKLSDNLNKFVANNPQVDKCLSRIEEKTKVKKIYQLYGGIGLIAAWLILGHGAALLCNMIGFLYPMYMSVKAIESDAKEDDTQWLMYWVVFAFFSVFEFFGDILVGWIPAYWFCKCIFLLWCMSKLNGAEKVYRYIILPWFQKNVAKLDKALEDAKKVATDFVGDKDVLTEAANLAIEASNGEFKKDA